MNQQLFLHTGQYRMEQKNAKYKIQNLRNAPNQFANPKEKKLLNDFTNVVFSWTSWTDHISIPLIKITHNQNVVKIHCSFFKGMLLSIESLCKTTVEVRSSPLPLLLKLYRRMIYKHKSTMWHIYSYRHLQHTFPMALSSI